MPSPLLFLLIATLLPLAGFALLLPMGKRLGNPLAGWVGTAILAASFAFTLVAMVKWYEGKHGVVNYGMADRPIARSHPWLPTGPGINQRLAGWVDLAVYVDSLTIAMFATVTLCATLLHILAIGFMRRDPRFAPFFACGNFLCFGTLAFVLSGSFALALAFWLVLGFATSLLMGFWSDRRTAYLSVLRGFVIGRVGDVGLFIGVGILLGKVGNLNYPTVWAALAPAAAGRDVVLQNGNVLPAYLLTLIGVSLFVGAIARSALFPLHAWISDVAASPAPAAAMICSCSTLAMGVYFVGRIFPLLTPDARYVVALIGVTTLVVAGLIAAAQADIQKLLIWSSVSQIGYMMLALGVGSWVGGLFHLITHAFFKALLFAASAGVITSMSRETRLREFGGLLFKLPVTAGLFAIAVLASAGTPLLSGHSSLSAMMTDIAAFCFYATRVGGRGPLYWALFILPVAVSALTAFYMTRCWMLTFAGPARNPRLAGRASEHPALWGPLLVLGFLSIVAGGSLNVVELLQSTLPETRVICTEVLSRIGAPRGTIYRAFDQAWPARRPSNPEPATPDAVEPVAPLSTPAALAHEQGALLARTWMNWTWLLGIAPAVVLYRKGDRLSRRLLQFPPLNWLHAWVLHGMFFDELYDWTVVNAVLGLIKVVGWLDVHVIRGVHVVAARLMRRRLDTSNP